jgi:carbon-monoxide dehydrogenase medium subunit
MNLWQNYIRPKNLSEAMDAFATAPRPLVPIAGGSVSEMTALEMRGDELYIGASVPVNRVATTPEVLRHAQALTEACNLIAGPQVRNVATLGGNVAHALPAADGTIALLALDAQAEIAGTSGLRCIPFRELFLGPGKSSLKHGEELLVGFHLALRKDQQASCFKRIMRPQGVALPILNCAVWLERGNDLIQDVRVAVGPGGGTPFRATQAEDSLRGRAFDHAAFETALEALLGQAKFRTSARRAGADYRRHIVSGLFKDVIATAWQRSA